MASPFGINAVTFDAAGTLLQPWPSVGHIYASVAAAFGHKEISPSALDRNFAAAWRVKKQFDYSRAAWRSLVDATFEGLLAQPPEAEFFEALYQQFGRPEVWRVFDDVLPALAALRDRKMKLAVISNWDERLRPLLERLNLGRHFDGVVPSIEVGFNKPAPEIFRHAAALLGLPPRSILHVGDSLSEDWEGARSAGMRAVWLNRLGSTDEPETITSLSALPLLLGTPAFGDAFT